ncbi:helix-turn-helix domain-containing protein [Changchengzhania lutea]|uniref:helix-turn-helix domain-containing protein n=1 Tax=Changchengzhania lutea TaxID=2049305 RepID=UPI00115E7843|nr:AraC family transcriptional regulator [Changchengzhania lutea]
MSSSNTSKLLFNLTDLQSSLGGHIEEINGIKTLYFDNENGKGHFRFLKFGKGLVSIFANVHLTSSFIFNIGQSKSELLNFISCLNGSFSYASCNSHTTNTLAKQQTAAVESEHNFQNFILIKAGCETTFSVICIDKAVYFKDVNGTKNAPKSKLLSLLRSIEKKGNKLHLKFYNLEIVEYVNQLFPSTENNAITEFMRFEGASYLIFANHIKQIYESTMASMSQSNLTDSELEKVQSLGEDIIANPEDDYTVNMLCRSSGLSPSKLQLGFKAMFNRTVSEHIRFVRLKKAEHLLKTTDLNISEIVYTIGFTSRSYFCKIFKKEYGYSPKQFKKKSFTPLVEK